MNDRIGYALISLLILVLPVSALMARRVPLGTILRYGAAWVAIFGFGYLLVTYFT